MTPPTAPEPAGTPVPTSAETDGRRWAVVAARAADEKLATDTVVLDVGDVLGITDLFVITSGGTNRQVRSIVEAVEERIGEEGGPKPRRVEGLGALEWVLMDYGDFVVHVFSAEARAFYDLERLWGDRPRVAWQAA